MEEKEGKKGQDELIVMTNMWYITRLACANHHNKDCYLQDSRMDKKDSNFGHNVRQNPS